MKMKAFAIGIAGQVIGLVGCTNSKAESGVVPIGTDVPKTNIVTPRSMRGYQLKNSVLHRMQVKTGVHGDTVICTFGKPQERKQNQKKIVLSEN